MRFSKYALRLAVTLPLAVALVACGGTSGPAASSPAASSTPLITTGQAKVGDKMQTVLKNSIGRTLYYFTADKPDKVACTGGCATNWPPLLAGSADVPGSVPGLPGKVTALNGDNGKQVLYNGHPLYTYSKDADSANAFGQGIGGKWFVATPDLATAGTAYGPG
jgi:predicted lipoprotein with Yx(FWY)xxD motif